MIGADLLTADIIGPGTGDGASKPGVGWTGAVHARARRLPSGHFVVVSDSGDYSILAEADYALLRDRPALLSRERLAELRSKFILGTDGAPGQARLLRSRIAARQDTVLSGPTLHIFVTTLQCAHSCQYCQVSRSLSDDGFAMSIEDLERSCTSIFESPADCLTVEFQGGDPLLRFDLVKHAIERIEELNREHKRKVRYVVASTLHQLTPDLCAFLKRFNVYLSTSVDGPESLHNRNRPVSGRNSYARTVAGIQLARQLLGPDSVSALMTASREALEMPEAIVDTYVELGFSEIFLRPLSRHGFARRNARLLGYSVEAFRTFYERAFERVLYWNRRGVPLREVSASIALNKMLWPFDAGFVDLQSPSGSGLAVLVYNYDGYVYPSDEARMLAAAGDMSLRLGRIGDALETLLGSTLQRELIAASLSKTVPECRDCAYNPYCGPDPVAAYNEQGSFWAPVQQTDHCRRQLWLFDFLFEQLRAGDARFVDLACRWAQPVGEQGS